MRYVRFLLLVCGLVFVLTVEARSQNSSYSDPMGNVGSWSWGKSQFRNEESEERAPGETSWERMQAEQSNPAESGPPRQEVLKSFSPLGLWRWWSGEKDTDSADSTSEEFNSDSTGGETLDDSQEPAAETK